MRDQFNIIPSAELVAYDQVPRPGSGTALQNTDILEDRASSAIATTVQQVAKSLGIEQPSVAKQQLTARISALTKTKRQALSKLRHPITSSAIAVLLNRHKAGSNWDGVFTFLALALSESQLNPAASFDGYTTYQGRRVRAHVTGLLQFTRSTYDNALSRGLVMMRSQPILRNVINALNFQQGFKPRQWASPATDGSQYIAILGQIARLQDRIAQQWTFIPRHGWTPHPAIATKPVTRRFIALAARYLKEVQPGHMALASFYHVNGLGGFSQQQISHENRIRQDVENYLSLTSTVDIEPLVRDAMNVALSNFLYQGDVEGSMFYGDPQDDDLTALNAAILSSQYLTANRARRVTYDRTKLKPLGTGIITSPWSHARSQVIGNRMTTRPHYGVDLRAKIGTPVFSLVNGTVLSVRRYAGTNFGLAVLIASTSGQLATRYAHLSAVFVKEGDLVRKGQVVALSGASGTRAPHLHVEVLKALNDGSSFSKGVNPSSLGIDVREAVNA